MTAKKLDTKVRNAIDELRRRGAAKAVKRAWDDFKRENPDEEADELNLYVLFDDNGDFLRWGIEHGQYFTGHSGPTVVVPISAVLEWSDVKREIEDALSQFFDE